MTTWEIVLQFLALILAGAFFALCVVAIVTVVIGMGVWCIRFLTKWMEPLC